VVAVFRLSTRELAKEPVGAVSPFSFPGGGAGADAVFLGVEGTVTKLARGYLVHMQATWRHDTVCDRCLDPVTLVQSASVDQEFGPEPSDDVRALAEGEIDLGPTLDEMTVIERPLKVLCREGCLGLCPVCGQNQNHGTCACRREEMDPRLAGLRHLRPPEA
jgi:uncharacterized protein